MSEQLIFEDGSVVTFEGGRWWSDTNKRAAKLCEGIAESFDLDRPEYHPNYERAVAVYVADRLGIVISDPDVSSDEDDAPGLIY